MADTMVTIRSVKQYFKEYGINGIGKGGDRTEIHNAILHEFKQEIFGQITMRYHDAEILSKPEETIDEATRIGVRNILDQADRKWRRLCTEFSKYKETFNLIEPKELMEYVKDIVKIQESEAKNPGETPVDMVPEVDEPVILNESN